MTPYDPAQRDEPLAHPGEPGPADETVHPHYAAPPPSKEVSGEGRILQALTIASWVGKLIDPLLHRDQAKDEPKPKLP